MESKAESKRDLQEIVGKIWAAKWRVLLFQLMVAAACIAIIFLYPRSYQSRAKMYFQLGKETVGIDPTASTGSMVSIQSTSREDEIISAIEVLKSRGIIGQVVDELTPEVVLSKDGVEDGTKKKHPLVEKGQEWIGKVIEYGRNIDPVSDRERAIILIEKNMDLRTERKSEVVEIMYEAKSPQLAQSVVEAMVSRYQVEHSRLHRNDQSEAFFETQQSEFSKELQFANQQLKEAKNRIGIASISGQRDVLESLNKDIAQNIDNVERERYEIEARIKTLQNDLIIVPERINSVEVEKPNTATDMQSQQLYALQLQETDLKSKYTAGHPKLIAIQKQLAEAEAKYKLKETTSQETTDDINPIHRELTLDLLKLDTQKAGVLGKIKTLEKQRLEILEKLREINSHEIEVANLEREQAIREKKYLTYTDSLEQARINKELERMRVSSVVVASPATLQERPVSPSKAMVALFGLGLICAGGAALALLLAKLDDRLTTPVAVRSRIGIPVLATLPKDRYLVAPKIAKVTKR
jgi:polysaccharide biosynthesis protein PslE